MDWPNTYLDPLPIITPWSEESLGNIIATLGASSTITSATITQNQAYYYPFTLDKGATAVKMFYHVGATQNGNIDLGIYDGQFRALVTLGATAMGVANTLQEGNIADTYLPPGKYFMACSISSATGTALRISPADEIALVNYAVLTQATAHPLPTPTATPIRSTDANPAVILMGVSFDTLI